MTTDEVMEIIDKATEPKVMSKEQALDFLETIEADIETRIEALRIDINEE